MLKPYSTSNMHSLRSEERPGRKLGDFWSAQWPQGGPSREKKTKKERKRRETTENLAKKNEGKGKKKQKTRTKAVISHAFGPEARRILRANSEVS